MNSNDSFFAVKQSNISRGISTNLLTTSPRASPTAATAAQQQQQQQDRVPSTNTSPSTSGSITRPPMSSQRPRDNISSKITGHIPSLANTSFSSAGSPDGSMTSGSIAQGVTPVPLTAAPSQEHALPDQGSVSSVNLSAAKGTTLETTALATGAGNNGKSAPAGSDQHTAAVAVSSASAQQSQQRSQQNNQSSSSSHHATHGHDRSHGRQSESTSSSNKHRTRTESSKDIPRPSATVSPAPIPAMHWTRAKVHGQIPPKDLRAQTVNLVGESVYVFGGCDPKNCFNTLYIFDAGK